MWRLPQHGAVEVSAGGEVGDVEPGVVEEVGRRGHGGGPVGADGDVQGSCVLCESRGEEGGDYEA